MDEPDDVEPEPEDGDRRRTKRVVEKRKKGGSGEVKGRRAEGRRKK